MNTQSPEHLDRATLWWIVAAAVAVRVLWALIVPVVPISDSIGYDAFARTLAEHQMFGWTKDEPFAFWPPGASFLHALVYKIFGFHHEAIVAFNIAVSAAIILVSANVAERLFGARIALWTAIVLAAWPTLIIYCTVIASELPYVLASILALAVWISDRSLWFRVVAAGALIGIAALIRPLALLLPAVYAGSIVLQSRLDRTVLREQLFLGAGAALAMLIVISPWTYRNYLLYGEPVLISTNGGITLWMGNAPGTDGSYLPIPHELSSLPDNEQARILGGQAREYILNDPVAFVVRSARKLGLMFANESIGVVWNAKGIQQAFGSGAEIPLKRFTQVTWLGILLLAIIGVVALCRDRGAWHMLFSPVLVSIAFNSVVYSIAVAQDRYHLSFAAQIAMFSAAGFLAVRTLVLDRNAARLAARRN